MAHTTVWKGSDPGLDQPWVWGCFALDCPGYALSGKAETNAAAMQAALDHCDQYAPELAEAGGE